MSGQMLNTLKRFQKLKMAEKRRAIQQAPDDFLIFLSECFLNILNGNIRSLKKTQLLTFRRQLEVLTNQNTRIIERRVILASPKGLKLLSKTVGPVIEYLDS